MVMIWVDPNIHSTEKNYHESITKLKRITELIYIFTKSDQCVHFLDTTNEENVALIVSNTLGEQLVPIVFDKLKLKSIYIFNQEKQIQVNWANKWEGKMKGTFYDIQDIFEAIKPNSG
ncbi:unnamed protein product [Rotaria sp. Silwood1]|nr:unnamed protein product [Rotaria sp. Silwood1]